MVHHQWRKFLRYLRWSIKQHPDDWTIKKDSLIVCPHQIYVHRKGMSIRVVVRRKKHSVHIIMANGAKHRLTRFRSWQVRRIMSVLPIVKFGFDLTEAGDYRGRLSKSPKVNLIDGS